MIVNTTNSLARNRCRCQNCQWKGNETDCDVINDIFERVAPGEPMPSGQCPKCGALCQPEREHIQVEYDRNYCGGDYSGVGEFALIPVDKIAFEQQGLAEAFEIQVGLPRCHIIHWCWDERYDADGDPLD